MDMNAFMEKLLQEAASNGIETAEVFYQEGNSFSAESMNGSIDSYEVAHSCGLSLRGTVHGRMGYASTQAFDDAAIRQLIDGVKESAELVEGGEQDEIFAGEADYPEPAKVPTDLDNVTAEEKLSACLAIEKAAKQADERIAKVEGASVSSGSALTRLKNSYGLDLSHRDVFVSAMVMPIAKDGDSTATAVKVFAGREFSALDAEKLGREAAEESLKGLHGAPVKSGAYHVILHWNAVRGLLRTFCGVFSAENAQQNMSLFAGKEGEKVASDVLTLMDDPLLPGGFGSCPFDAEGSVARTKAVIDQGVLTTLLHSRKTAKKQGVASTGNASRASYAAPVHVAPTNLFIKPGNRDLDAMMEEVGEGLVIRELGGLHAGANPISGDFSLISKGWLIEGGKRGRPVEQITVAGNFYQLLQQIRAVGSDLTFQGSGIGAPSVDVGMMDISGI